MAETPDKKRTGTDLVRQPSEVQLLDGFDLNAVQRDLRSLIPDASHEDTRLKLIPLLRERLQGHLFLYFQEVKKMHPIPKSEMRQLSEQDLIVFIVDTSAAQTHWDYQIAELIQHLATLYFYTGDEKLLEQLTMLMAAIVLQQNT